MRGIFTLAVDQFGTFGGSHIKRRLAMHGLLGEGLSMASDEPSDTQSYDRLIQVAAGSITAAASALGVLGVGAGVAISLLRNWPAATLTAVSLAAVAVLAGITSAFTKPDLVLQNYLRASGIVLLLSVAFVAWTWLIVGRAYTTGAARTGFESRVWWLFALVWITATAGLAWFAWHKGRVWQVRAVLVVGALVLFGSAILGLVVLAATASRSSARPAIAATIEPLEKPTGFVSLSGTVTAAGLSADDRYEIIVTLLDERVQASNAGELFHTFAGPAADGSLDYKFKVTFPGQSALPWIAVTARLSGGRLSTKNPLSSCSANGAGTPPPFGTTCVLLKIPKAVPTP
jgi:hypothetical protein